MPTKTHLGRAESRPQRWSGVVPVSVRHTTGDVTDARKNSLPQGSGQPERATPTRRRRRHRGSFCVSSNIFSRTGSAIQYTFARICASQRPGRGSGASSWRIARYEFRWYERKVAFGIPQCRDKSSNVKLARPRENSAASRQNERDPGPRCASHRST